MEPRLEVPSVSDDLATLEEALAGHRWDEEEAHAGDRYDYTYSDMDRLFIIPRGTLRRGPCRRLQAVRLAAQIDVTLTAREREGRRFLQAALSNPTLGGAEKKLIWNGVYEELRNNRLISELRGCPRGLAARRAGLAKDFVNSGLMCIEEVQHDPLMDAHNAFETLVGARYSEYKLECQNTQRS